ncbi:MAG: hypothetical protein ACAH83_15025 [Alphaproteobacteria bacterium]
MVQEDQRQPFIFCLVALFSLITANTLTGFVTQPFIGLLLSPLLGFLYLFIFILSQRFFKKVTVSYDDRRTWDTFGFVCVSLAFIFLLGFFGMLTTMIYLGKAGETILSSVLYGLFAAVLYGPVGAWAQVKVMGMFFEISSEKSKLWKHYFRISGMLSFLPSGAALWPISNTIEHPIYLTNILISFSALTFFIFAFLAVRHTGQLKLIQQDVSSIPVKKKMNP